MKEGEINKLKEVLGILKEYTKSISSISSVEDKCIVTVFDESEPTMYTETFNSKEEFLERFEDDELDCEGFSWLLWEEGRYNRLTGNGCYYHLTKLTDI